MPLRSLRRALRGTDWPVPFARTTAAYTTAQTLVRLYYVLTIYVLVEAFTEQMRSWTALDASELPLLWPLRWATWVGMETAVYLIALTAVLGAVLAAVQPNRWPLRLLAFAGLFLTVALANSFGKINHNMHGWLAVAFCFMLLPAAGERPSRRQRLTYLSAFWAAQALLLWFYTMSGAWKVSMGIEQLAAGDVHAFHPYAMAHQVANRLLQDNSASVLGPLLLDFPQLGWPLYVSAIYLELFAFMAAFRPSLHRLWGLSLALFHIGTYLTMTITFNQNILLLGLMLVASPFHPPRWRWQRALRDLPLIGRLLAWAISLRPSRRAYSHS